MTFLKELNPVQKEAATFEGGPLLVIAGAGSGKTRVLTSRIAYLVLKKGVAAERILSVTFTNKAAGEMRERLRGLLGKEADRLWLGTFHSVGLRILKKDGRLIGIDRDFTVYGDDDQLRLVKLVMNELSLSDKAFSPRMILSRIDHAKNEGLYPEDIARGGDFPSKRVAEVYSLYQKKLREMNAMDFGDLICEVLRLFKNHPDVLARYRENFRHVLVDEYQDTNKVQCMLVNSLASGWRNIFAVGDPDQSIYAWRGADIRNIMEFERDWKGATVLRLEENYRSTRHILSAANSLIEKNKNRYKKELRTAKEGGVPVKYFRTDNEHDEAGEVIGHIRGIMDEDTTFSYRDFSVFYRTNAQSRILEEHFMKEGIPYTIVGNVKFYERQEIKDALAYLKVLVNPKDILSLKRIINVPPRGIGAATQESVSYLAQQGGMTLYEGFEEAIKKGVIKKPEQIEFFKAFKKVRGESPTLPLHETALKLLEDTGYMGMWEKERSEEALQRIENIHELISAIKDFGEANVSPSIGAFLEHVSLVSDVDLYEDKDDRATLMTLHSAKGLEFPVVFMVGMEEGLFPHIRAMESANEIEEERRLCYVGMTRAKESLFLFSAANRSIFGETKFRRVSRFIEEISPEFLEKTEQGGAYCGGVFKEPRYTFDDSQVGPPTGRWDEPWKVGMKVLHPDFGAGVIKAKEGLGEKTKLTVCFLHGGTKKLAVKYASLTAVF
ncbi:MAG: UvrD-helicase domain-containing protein [Deltaproteobacteria bacterium]|nr:UvrD-helicase domain-containing protein [Deltaproteobacteria bacterium]